MTADKEEGSCDGKVKERYREGRGYGCDTDFRGNPIFVDEAGGGNDENVRESNE